MTDGKIDPVLFGRLIAWVFGLAPALLFAVTWTDQFATWQVMARAFGVPVIFAELAIIVVSLGEGIRLRLPRLVLALMLAWAALAWITASTALHPGVALVRTGVWTIHLLFGLALVNLRHHGMLDLKAHLQAQQAGFVLFFALLVAFVATVDQTPVQRVFELPGLAHVRWFGYYAAGIVGLAVLGYTRGHRFALVAATAAFALTFWTGTRGAVFAVAVGLVSATVLFPSFRRRRVWLGVFLCALAGLAVAYLLQLTVPLSGPSGVARSGSTGRVGLWLDTLDYIWMRPLFGWGEAQTAYLASAKLNVAQPHNVVLQILHAWGFVGGALCLALAAWIVPAFLRGSNTNVAPFQFATLILAAYACIDGTLYYTQSTALFVLCCAVAVVSGLSEEADAPETDPKRDTYP